MRHAKSAWDTGESDFNRPLNDRGERAAARMAEWLAENDLAPDRIVSSAAVRTHDTALAVMYACGVDRAMVDFEHELYLASAGAWFDVVKKQTCARLLICGHNPGLDDLVDALSADDPPLSTNGKLMTTAAVAHLSFDTHWSDISVRSGNLLSLTRPRELDGERWS